MKSLGYSKRADQQRHKLPDYLPDFIADSILEVNFERLAKLGVTHIMLDLDQTIRHRHSLAIEEEIVEYLDTARKDYGFKEIYIVTNNRRDIQSFGNHIQAKIFQPYKHRGKTVRKPNRRFFENILARGNINPSRAVMIGDKLRFDIAGAKKVGIYTVFVNPLGKDYWYDRLLLTRQRDKRMLTAAKSKHKLFSLISTEDLIKEALLEIDFKAKKVQPFEADARGSQPFIATNGKQKVFIKLKTGKTNLFDWIFKIVRHVLFRRLEDEVPFVSPKQAVEHEAYVSSQAHKAGVRTPKIIGLIDLQDHRFALVTQFIEGKTINYKKPNHLSDEILIDLWQQISKLHSAHIAHRDLRTSNILLGRTNHVWLIDYDFSTVAATNTNLQRDNVELLVSLATIVGPKRSIKFASTALVPKDFKALLPLLRYSNLSAATRSDVRQHKGLIKTLRDYVDVLSVAKES